MISGSRTAAFTLTLLCGLALPARAQATLRPYVVGGWSIGFQETAPLPDDQTPVVNGVSVGGGLALPKGFGVEGSLGWHTAGATQWSLSVFGNSGQILTTDRDVHLVGLVRWSQACGRRVCPSVVAGAGLNSHKIVSHQVTVCSLTCIPVNQSDQADLEPDHSEFLLTGGMDFRFRLAGRLDLLPGFRVRHIFREKFLTEWSSRGPVDREATSASAQLNAIYRFK